MSMDKILGPATLVYLVSATVAALWWASDLTRRVDTIEHSTVTAERIARLEAEVQSLTEGTRELKSSIKELVNELKRSP
ncbi:MAG: hypothetical protein KBA31_19400 [Alphaproteobacteria bacterium]|nr:hypothetical protein [Alphaproteobacteria bacterium]